MASPSPWSRIGSITFEYYSEHAILYVASMSQQQEEEELGDEVRSSVRGSQISGVILGSPLEVRKRVTQSMPEGDDYFLRASTCTYLEINSGRQVRMVPKPP